MKDMFGRRFRMNDVLYDAKVGTWYIEITEGEQSRMYADRAMLELLGIDGMPTPEECYTGWYDRIETEYLEIVGNTVETMIGGKHGEVSYAWNHPQWGQIYVRCGGTRDKSYEKGIRLCGYHQNVSELVTLKKESRQLKSFNEIMLTSLKDLYFSVMVIDLEVNLIYPLHMVKGSEEIYSEDLNAYHVLARLPEFYHPNDRERLSREISVENFFHLKEAGEKKFIREYRRKIDGEYHWVSISGYFIQEGHKSCQMMLTVQDIDEQKKQEKEYQQYLQNRLEGSLELLRMSLQNTNIFEYLYYPQEQKITLPDEVAQYYNCEKEYTNIRETFAKNMVDAEYYEEFCSMYEKIRNGKKNESMCYKSSNGEYWHRVSITGVSFDDAGKTTLAVGIIEDITRQKQMEKESRRYQSLYKFMVNNEYDGICIVDLKTGRVEVEIAEHIAPAHGSAEEEPEEVTNRFLETFVCREDQERYHQEMNTKRVIERLERGEGVVHFYFQSGEEGRKRHKELTYRYFNKKRTKLFVCIRDIEQQNRIEKKSKEVLQEAFESANRANEAKSGFLTKMSHDIRTPMNAIVGMTAIAEAHIDDKERVQDCLDKIKIANRHLLSLINEVLDMSRMESGKQDLTVEKVDLQELLYSVVSMIQTKAEEKHQELSVEILSVTHKRVIGDYLRLQKIFNNILANAVKYTQKNGTIKVKMKEFPSVHKDYGCYRFIFQDNGYGMSKEFQKKIFEPFERSDDSRVSGEEGTGLGMSIVYNLVQLMKGDIQVISELNQGSEFTVTLWLKLLHHEQSGNQEAIQSSSCMEGSSFFPGKRALVVEDNELNVEIASEILKMFGLEVVLAYNGAEAVEHYQKQKSGYFDIIFMDIQMPVMDGYASARVIRDSGHSDSAKIPIVAMTANAFSEDVQRAVHSGMNDHIAKPIEIQRFKEVLTKWLS